MMNGKTAIVTGGGRGIGRAICRRFARDGVNVLAVARSEPDLAETKRLVGEGGGRCTTLPCDVTRRDQVHEMAAFAKKELGGVDILVNNAGFARNRMVEDLDPKDFDTMVAVNMAAAFYACQAVWPMMRQRGGGVIVNISSMAAIDPFPGFAAYGAMKSYIDALTRNLAKEGQEHGIRVYAVGPGAVDTQMLRGPFPDFPAEQCLQPEEVAEVVWTVTQPACRYTAGQTIYLAKT